MGNSWCIPQEAMCAGAAVSELRKVESRQWQGWGNLGCNVLMIRGHKSYSFLSI